jgi:hypothetical protein
MPAKAGKFVLRAGDMGVYSLDGTNSGFQVDGIGFKPEIVVVMSAGLTAEDSWVTAPNIWGGMSMWSNDADGNIEGNTGLTEFWGTDFRPSSFWSNSGVIWFKSSHSGGGSAIYIANTHDDGFYIGYPDGGYEGGYGIVCYYLAMKSEEGQAAQVYGYPGGPTSMNVGFQPAVYMTLGSGGLSGGAGDIGFLDFSVPSWGFGGFDNQVDGVRGGPEWMANGLAHTETVEQVRYFLDGWGDQWVFDGYTASQIVGNSAFFYGRSATDFTIGITDGFPAGINERVAVHMLGDGLYSGNQVTPNPVGIPLDVDVGFTPEAVVFLGPQTNHGNFFGIPWGGRCFGFLTEDFQCCIAWGAFQHANSDPSLAKVASFCTSQFGWISNFTSDFLADPTNPNYGTVELTATGFTMESLALPKFNQYVHYAAYGFAEEAPQFFRVL